MSAQVAVVIPAYNPGERLRTALDSVLAQRGVMVEVVVVDDGGTEDLSWVDALPVRRHRQSNAGVSTARNVGVGLTSAPLVAFLDQDDEWLPGKLTAQVAAISDSPLSVTDFLWMPANEPAIHDAPLTAQSLADGGHFCLSTLMVRRDAFVASGGFDPALAMQQDYELVLRMLRLSGRPAAMVPEVLARYWVHEGNASRDHARATRERLGVLRDQDGLDISAGVSSARRLGGSQAWASFRATHAARDLALALRWNPTHVAAEIGRKIRG